MFCQRCGTQLPDNARFCFSCGATIGAAAGPAGAAPPPPPPPPPPSTPTIAPVGAKALKCPQCGAPLQPEGGEMVISCEYCGATVSLGGTGWKPLARHSILLPKVVDSAAALDIVHAHVDSGFLHRKAFEESKIVEQRLSFVPFWVMPVTATTNYQYTDVAVSVAGTAGSIAAAELLGGALGGRRGGFAVVPMAAPVNATRQDTLVGSYEFPVVAVKGMSAYQPKNYQFGLSERTLFDKRAVPAGAPVLNGDLGEDAAKFSAKSYVMQLQTEEAHKKHTMVSNLSCAVEVADGELLHVPIWYIVLERKGQRTIVLIDAHAGRVMQTVS
jgi:hypothetical protein